MPTTSSGCVLLAAIFCSPCLLRPSVALPQPNLTERQGARKLTIMTVEDPPLVQVRTDPFNRSSPLLPWQEWGGGFNRFAQSAWPR